MCKSLEPPLILYILLSDFEQIFVLQYNTKAIKCICKKFFLNDSHISLEAERISDISSSVYIFVSISYSVKKILIPRLIYIISIFAIFTANTQAVGELALH